MHGRTLSLTALGLGALCSTAVALSSNDGDARVRPSAQLTRDGLVHFVVGCPGGPACRGTARLTTKGVVPTRRGGRRRVVSIAQAPFADLQPGQTVELTARVRPEARYFVSRRSRVEVLGRVANEKATGVTPTVSFVTLSR
jgi:hypothetical protein